MRKTWITVVIAAACILAGTVTKCEAKTDEKIVISDDIVITIVEAEKDRVKIGIDAPNNVKVFRKELLDAVKETNEESLETSMDLFKELSDSIDS